MRWACRVLSVLGTAVGAIVLSGHVGSPNVFFAGKTGPYDVRVTIRPPDVVPGVAQVTVRTTVDVRRVSIRPVYWRAGSKGAPSADEMRRLAGEGRTFEGSLWLMQRGAYAVDVRIEGAQGTASVLVPVASLATGRLEMGGGLAAVLLLLGIVLGAGLVNIVYKGAGEALVPAGFDLDDRRRRRARRIAAVTLPLIAVAAFGGAKWWEAVDRDYERTIYRPSPLVVTREGTSLRIELADTVWQRGVSPLVPDHGKLMHLFLVRADDARAFAHLHPVAADSGAVPRFTTRLPPLPAGRYHAFGDVVHETGFERTLVGSLTVPEGLSEGVPARRLADPDDAWFAGDASRESAVPLGDGSMMRLDLVPAGLVEAGRDATIRISVLEPGGRAARLEPYLGMAAHAVVVRVDGTVYVHLHPMGTVTPAAQQVFEARDRGDTTATGRVTLAHAAHMPAPDSLPGTVEFPYAFPRGGSYRLFVQVKRAGRILTGAYAITVGERPDQSR